MIIQDAYTPLRCLADIEAIEQTPIEQRITRWDFALNLLNGCRIDPQRAALHATCLGDVDGPLLTWRFADLERRSVQVANFLRSQGVQANDAVAIVSPTVPGLFAAMIGTLLGARPFPINWMLEAEPLRDLMRESKVAAVIALGPTEGFNIWQRVQQAVQGLSRPVPVYTLHDPFGPTHQNDLFSLSGSQPGTLAFDRPVAQRQDVACYVHSGGTTGHPKIVRILHGGMVFRQWAANQGLAFTPHDVVLSDTPLFHIGGLLVRGLVSTADGHTTVIPSMHGARDKRYIANYCFKAVAAASLSTRGRVLVSITIWRPGLAGLADSSVTTPASAFTLGRENNRMSVSSATWVFDVATRPPARLSLCLQARSMS
ncbi:MAG: AMP-binding protein [Alphaproteobacteria bacterium]|nr:AMP-binding protein [Alphaproteobacteria bacterium]